MGVEVASVLWHQRPSASGRQLVMFPFLGGFGGSFNALIEHLETDWDVWTLNPPGHGASALPPVRELSALTDLYRQLFRAVLRPDAVFFGHSMGSTVAYYLLVAMATDLEFDGRLPSQLMLSASVAPRSLPEQEFGSASDEKLLAHLRSFGAFPDEVARDSELMARFVPAFRADYAILDQARRREVTRLEVDAQVIFSAADSQTPIDGVLGWQHYLSRPPQHHVLNSQGHMYVQSAPWQVSAVLDGLNRARPAVATMARVR